MSDSPQGPGSSTTASFLTEASRAFRFLVDEERCTPTVEAREWFPELSFHGPGVSVRVAFDFREYVLRVGLARTSGPHDREQEYGLYAWLLALGWSPPRDDEPNTQDDRIRRWVTEDAALLREFLDRILEAPASTVVAMDDARRARQAEHHAELKRRNYEAASESAAGAFRDSDWSRVVELLTPFADLLLPSDAAKLAYAAKRCSPERRD